MPVDSVKSGFFHRAFEGFKYYSNPSPILYRKTQNCIKQESELENRILFYVTYSEKYYSYDTLPSEKRKSPFQVHVLSSLYSAKEGVIEPWVIIFRTSVRCLILAARIETLFGHGTHFDFAKWVFRYISFDELTSSCTKRTKNIGISLFRISFAPAEILFMLAGSLAGIFLPDLGAQIRKSIHEIDFSLDKKEQRNIIRSKIRIKSENFSKVPSEEKSPNPPEKIDPSPSDEAKKTSWIENYKKSVEEREQIQQKQGDLLQELSGKMKDGSIPLQKAEY